MFSIRPTIAKYAPVYNKTMDAAKNHAPYSRLDIELRKENVADDKNHSGEEKIAISIIM